MRRLLSVLRRWKTFRDRPSIPVPFTVVCICGRAVEGLRAATARTQICSGCGETLFIAPRSPWPVAADDDAPRPVPPPARSPWLVPVAASLLTLSLVAVVLAIVVRNLSEPDKDGDGDVKPDGPTLAQSIADGKELLKKRRFREAARLLRDADVKGRRSAELMQLRREAELLAVLSPEPLQELVRKGQLNPDEWTSRFQEDYKGRSIVFDDVVRREPGGEHRLVHYQVIVDDDSVVVKLDLDLLRGLKALDQPRRLLFGARVSKVARDGKTWVVEFDRDSGVLLTDEGTAEALDLAPLDAELRRVLMDQTAWAAKLR